VLFEKLNAKVRSHLEEGRYVTLFFAALDPKERAIAYNNAGHAPPYLFRRRTGEVLTLSRTGFPIGLMYDARFMRRHGLVLEPSDLLLLYTDGITETMNAEGEMFGPERLQEVLPRLAALSPREAIKALDEEAAKFAGANNRQDDMTLIALKAV